MNLVKRRVGAELALGNETQEQVTQVDVVGGDHGGEIAASALCRRAPGASLATPLSPEPR